jgi:hypothetical protein
MRYVLVLVLVACGGTTSRPEHPTFPEERQVTCSGADVPVTSSAQCEESGVCYQLADGTWCTNIRTRWGL